MWKDLALVVIASPEEIKEMPGVVAHLTSLLSDKGINILETISCWSETLFVIAEKDITWVLEALKRLSSYSKPENCCRTVIQRPHKSF